MKPIVLISTNNKNLSHQLKYEASMYSSETTWLLPKDKNSEDAIILAGWYPEKNILSNYKKIKAIHSIGAGTDNLGSLLNANLPIYRIIDEDQKAGMLEYILWSIIFFQRDFNLYNKQQQKKQWLRLSQRTAKETSILILGLGEIGLYVAKNLYQKGYNIYGWSTSRKNIKGINCIIGKTELYDSIENIDFIVNLLPLNESTTGILDKNLFFKVKKRPILINCGRGGHVVEKDLIYALENKILSGAVLDVFEMEPLPHNNKLWNMNNVIITPHIASSASNKTIIEQISKQALDISSKI